MKIYVSEKYIEENDLNFVEEDFVEQYFMLKGLQEKDGFEVMGDVGLVEIQSLEQQNKEVLKEFADKLKNEIENSTYILTNLNINETYMGSRVTKQELFNLIIFDLLKERGVE